MTKNVYVVHFCKNDRCNNAWLDVDLTNAQSRPPSWKFCKGCCEEKGIDFFSQKPPHKKLSKKQLEILNKNKFSIRKKSK